MMRPMKIAGEQLLFGKGTLAHLENINAKKVAIIIGDDIVYKNGVMEIVEGHLYNAGIDFDVFMGVEPDPGLNTVLKGAKFMLEYEPDFILAIGGGSTMDAAKAMWIYYEHPHLTKLEQLEDKDTFPTLRTKAYFGCVPTTAGTASEVSRSIVITDNDTGYKHGIGNMEMMPDLAICDPITTVSMPKSVTAQTGFDALSHVLESYVSNRANHLSDILARSAIEDIFTYLPLVYNDLNNLDLREKMLNASMVAGLSFTNVSLGIVHSISHSMGSVFGIPHGSSNAILLPHVIKFNSQAEYAKVKYDELAKLVNKPSIIDALDELTKAIEMPTAYSHFINEDELLSKIDEVVMLSIKDGCTKTNPIIPTAEEFKQIIINAFKGEL